MKLIIYLLQVSACSAIFYLFYFLLLRRLTFFTINRWYLLGTLLLSFIIPTMHLPVTAEQHPAVLQPVVDFNQLQYFTANPVSADVQNIPVRDTIDIPVMLKYLYSAIAALSLIKLAFTLLMFIKRSKGEQLFCIDNVRVVKAGSNSSLFNVVFVNDNELSPAELKQIVAHELLHIRLWHSADRIIARITLAMLWFNPFAYFYIRSMEENHEFEVDRIATGGADKSEYAALLFKLSVAGNDYLMHSFSKVPLKNRIAMLFNKPTPNMKKIIYTLMLPVVALSSLAFANLKTTNGKQGNAFYTKTEFKDKNGVELVKREVHIPGSKGAMGIEDRKGASVVFIVNDKLYKESEVAAVETAVKAMKADSWRSGSTEYYKGSKKDEVAKYDLFFEFKGNTNRLSTLLDTVKNKYRQKSNLTPKQRKDFQKRNAEFSAYISSAEGKQKYETAERVNGKKLTYTVIGLIDTTIHSSKLSGYKLQQGRDEFLLPYNFANAKFSKGQFSNGDELEITTLGTMWNKGIPITITPTEVKKAGNLIYKSAPLQKVAFLYEANKVRYAYGKVTDIEKYANGKWKSAIVKVDDYNIKFNIKPNAPSFAYIQPGDEVTFRFVHEVKTGEKEYTVNDWVALSNQIKDYGVKNPDFFYKFYEKL
ncbi:hypothetical protein D0C36_02405 [Mucilaginibacter conchicola]|uniref:Peptidase M56 domain-containing protein n=1 Tax=Mucilaginibacter conchicola TaxID=2303333 RepID=A0A372NX01_9SPHI|nr:M56 family metallopeptidase [Mucilaginibacter conchicola]RFZ94424.1 hypothetical protein D0C36_02405 [Mucilaginibacter conchicola]